MSAWGLWLAELSGAPVGEWLAHYDPDLSEAEALRHPGDGYTGPDGGLVVTTPSAAGAKRYGTLLAALEDWQRVSRTRPTRADGRPNRPLSAFTVEPRRLHLYGEEQR